MNFPDVESLEEAEFLAPPPCLVTDEDRRRHRQVQRRIAIAERDEQLMRQWRAQFPNDVDNTDAFFANLRAQRRSNRRHRRAVAAFELENPNTTWTENDPRWDDIWTETTSDDE
jgi:cytochrome c peroxidase